MDVIERNDVVLRGWVPAPAEIRTLPSGDTLLTCRLVVRRPEPRPRGKTVDVLTCITYDRSRQRRAAAWQPGDVVEVEERCSGGSGERAPARLPCAR